jgi:NDP-sugar pyrophosphorylase family protein
MPLIKSLQPLPTPLIRSLRPVVLREAKQDASSRQLRRVRAVILLDGTVRRSTFAEAIDRSLLELPICAGRLVLDLWREHVVSMRNALQIDKLPCRIVVGRTTRPPALRWQDQQAGMSVEMDPSDLRGTGGVLRDLAEEYDEDDTLLVANAAQLLVEPLHVLASAAGERGGDVTVAANGDGTPSSFALLSCRALRQLPDVGFVDLKEQGLPLMASKFEVTTLWRSTAYGLPIRTPRDYLAAVRAHHRLAAGDTPHDQPFDERWRRNFAMVEEGAAVAPDATLHDAVVLRGAKVAAGALVADSVICARAVVRSRENVVRRLVGAAKRVAIGPDSR